MEAFDRKLLEWEPVLMLAICFAFGAAAWGQYVFAQESYTGDAYPQSTDAPATMPVHDLPPQPVFSQQQLDQMLAPIALYPDPLLSQILMASTYPLEVLEASRWSWENPNSWGEDAVRAVQDMHWDPSVKSLVAFPRILQMMDEKLVWTENLGDAFLAQQMQVMDTVQKLRQRAYAAGNLKSNEQVRVETEGQTIVVVPASPDLIYVPYYDPMVVYGGWWWPDYPPVYWAPWPGYFVVSGFAWGSAIFVSTGFFFGDCDWRHRRVSIVNVNNFYYPRIATDRRTVQHAVNTAPGSWHHDPEHRRGVPYRDNTSRNRYRQPEGTPEFRRSAPRSGQPSFTVPQAGETGKSGSGLEAGTNQDRSATHVRPESRRHQEGQTDTRTRPATQAQPVPESRSFELQPRSESQPRPNAGADTSPRKFESRAPSSETPSVTVKPPVQDNTGREHRESNSRPRGGDGSEGAGRGQGRNPEERSRDNSPGSEEGRRGR